MVTLALVATVLAQRGRISRLEKATKPKLQLGCKKNPQKTGNEKSGLLDCDLKSSFMFFPHSLDPKVHRI